MQTDLSPSSRQAASLRKTLLSRRGAPSQRTVETDVELLDRFRFVLECVHDEPWLPHSVKSLIVSQFIRFRKAQRDGTLTMDRAREAIFDLAVCCFAYNHLTLRSKTLRHIRVLDMELSGFERVTDYASEPVLDALPRGDGAAADS